MKNLYRKCRVVTGMAMLLVSTIVSASPSTNSHKDDAHSGEHSHEGESENHAEKDNHKEQGNVEEHGEERELPAGITSYDEHEGFSLSPEALKNFAIQTQSAPIQRLELSLPASAIIRSLKDTSIFVKVGERFRLVNVEVMNVSGAMAQVKLKDLPSRAFTVVVGVNFLKTIQLSLEEDPTEGHGH
jgi:hypothetical protein